jgi:hypothetical protein
MINGLMESFLKILNESNAAALGKINTIILKKID